MDNLKYTLQGKCTTSSWLTGNYFTSFLTIIRIAFLFKQVTQVLTGDLATSDDYQVTVEHRPAVAAQFLPMQGPAS